MNVILTPPRWAAPEDPVRRDRVTAPTTTTMPKGDAWNDVRALFSDTFGGALDNLALGYYQEYLTGVPVAQILHEARQTKEYAARFGGNIELEKNGRPRLAESTYLDLERTYRQVAAQFDIAPDFFDTGYLAKLIGGEKAPAEFQRQLTDWQTYERATRDPVAEAEINRQFASLGLVPSDGHYLMALLRPDVAPAHIERALAAGQVGAAAVQSGYGQIGLDTGLGLADRGVTVDQARSGFDTLAASRELFAPLPGEQGFDIVSQQEQVGAVFGFDGAARRRVERARSVRGAAFSGGGGVSGGRGGLSGLGPAS